jgi:hypothetical protein
MNQKEFTKWAIETLPEMIKNTDHIRITIDYGEVTTHECENDLIEDKHNDGVYKKYKPSLYRQGKIQNNG